MQITDDDIKRIEKLFFKNGGSFSDHKNVRIEFIKCIDKKIHLEACPGSGKTTALLAKIYLLSEKMPFEQNKGICVLTHTNVAIDIIKKQLGDKADKLFRHPNYFGTIQSFVDKFLAKNAYIKIYGYKLKNIDNEYFFDQIFSEKNRFENNRWLINNKGKYEDVVEYVANIEAIFNSFKKNDFKLNIETNETSNTYKIIKNIYGKIFSDGCIRYIDAYYLAMLYLEEYKCIKEYFSSRFKYVFIDEAQDTSCLQKKIIEKCFNDNVIIQWIGDENQAIMDFEEREKECVPKKDHTYSLLSIDDSKRISKPIADVINKVIERENKINGENDIEIKPIIILFDKNTKNKVIEKFAELITVKKSKYNGEYKTLYEISKITGYPVKAIGWIGKPKNDCLTIQSYYPYFNKINNVRRKIILLNIYTMLYLSKNDDIRTFTDKFYNCIIRALDLSNIKDKYNKKYSKATFINYVNTYSINTKDEINTFIFKFYKRLRNENYDVVFKEVSEYLIELLCNKIKYKLTDNSIAYIRETTLKDINKDDNDKNNIYEKNINGVNVKIYIDTVHGVKGETHTATLYLDTKYYKNGVEYFIDALTINIRTNEDSNRIKYAKKIAYVAFSRPTHLLCIAIEKNTISKEKINNNLFDIIDLS